MLCAGEDADLLSFELLFSVVEKVGAAPDTYREPTRMRAQRVEGLEVD